MLTSALIPKSATGMTVKKEGWSRVGGSLKPGDVCCKSLVVDGESLTLGYYSTRMDNEEFIGRAIRHRPDKDPGDMWMGGGHGIERDGEVVYEDSLLHYIDEYNDERVIEYPHDNFSVSGKILHTNHYLYICGM